MKADGQRIDRIDTRTRIDNFVKLPRDTTRKRMLASYAETGVIGMTGRAEEVDRNYDAFIEQLPAILSRHRGEYALLHDRRIVRYFDDALTAMKEGFASFGDGRYSVQEVTNERDSLGFYSHAGGTGTA